MAETLYISCGCIPKLSLHHSTRINADCIRCFDVSCHNDLKKLHYLFSLVEIKYNLSVIFQ